MKSYNEIQNNMESANFLELIYIVSLRLFFYVWKNVHDDLNISILLLLRESLELIKIFGWCILLILMIITFPISIPIYTYLLMKSIR